MQGGKFVAAWSRIQHYKGEVKYPAEEKEKSVLLMDDQIEVASVSKEAPVFDHSAGFKKSKRIKQDNFHREKMRS